MRKGFNKEEGPFVRALDRALSSFNVERQAYYSGTFVGNHVHRTLKPANTTTLCESIVEVAQHHCPTMLHQTQEIARKFSNVFRLFRDCHAIYDGKTVTDDDIVELGEQDWCW